MKSIITFIGNLMRAGKSRVGAAMTGARTYVKGNRQSVLSVGVVAGAVAALLISIFIYDGYRSTSYDLDESAVWVTRDVRARIGRINADIGHHDAAQSIQGRSDARLAIDILQNGRDVLVVEKLASAETAESGSVQANLYGVEASTVQVAEAPVEVGGLVVTAGGPTVAVMDPAVGEVHIGTFDHPPTALVDAADESEENASDADSDVDTAGSDASDDNADEDENDSSIIKLGPLGTADSGSETIAVSRSGVFAGYSATDHALLVGPGDSPVVTEFDGDPIDPQFVHVSFVGDQAIVLDTQAAELFVGGQRHDLTTLGQGLALQVPGDNSNSVVIASSTGLHEVDLGNGAITDIHSFADPVVDSAAMTRPVFIDGRAYGAWGGTAPRMITKGSWGVKLEDLKEVVHTAVNESTLAEGGQFKFRINRNNVVLNETTEGAVFQVDDSGDVRRIDDWQGVDGKDQPDNPTDDNRVNELQEEPQPPVAENDRFGARPNRPTRLAVLDNDSDPNGDALLISEFSAIDPDQGTLGLIEGGQALQITPAVGAENSEILFSYKITDGTPGHVAEASVTVVVYGDEHNTAPRRKSNDPWVMDMTAQSTRSYEILNDWIDDEGDPILLQDAVLQEPHASFESVNFVPSGQLTIQDTGKDITEKTVSITVRDDFQGGAGPLSTEEDLTVTVHSAGSLKPQANPDVATVRSGQTVVFYPLANDISPSGSKLNITKVEARPTNPTPLELQLQRDDNSVVFSAPGQIKEPTDYNYTYEIRDDNGATATGVIRVHVLGEAENQPPTAGHDIVYMRRGQQKTVDLLVNDYDPDGDLLSVTGISEPPSDVTAVVLEYRRVRLHLNSRVADSVRTIPLTYTLTDGIPKEGSNDASVTGHITIVILPDGSGNQVPIANDDVARVRVGDVTTIPVMANDIDPDGDDLELMTEIVRNDTSDGGEAFVSGNVIRFLAPDKPAVIKFNYSVRDTSGDADSAQVVVHVVDRGTNSPPRPYDLEARVRQGSSVKVKVPLVGVDPDGDYVVVDGISSAPHKGVATVSEDLDEIEYTAHIGASGQDSFEYRVIDSEGARNTATIRVMILDPSPNRPPVAFDDQMSLKPGRSACVPVTLNDYDPDGDEVSFSSKNKPQVAGDGSGASVETVPENKCLKIQADRVGAPPVHYWIQDSHGLTQEKAGVVYLDVRDDAPNQAPVAKDDIIAVSDLVGKTQVSVDVRKNDYDPDGSIDGLTVDVPNSGQHITVNQDTQEVIIQLGEEFTTSTQIIRYTVTDPDGGVGTAFIRIPPAEEERATLQQTKFDAVSVVAGETLTVNVAEWVSDPNGETVALTNCLPSIRVWPSQSEFNCPDTATITYTPSVDELSAKGSLSFEVTSGDPDDPNAPRLIVNIDISIEPAPGKNRPPAAMPVLAAIQVVQGEEAELSLGQYYEDPDGDPLTIELIDSRGLPSGIDASVANNTLKVVAALETQPVEGLVVGLSISDGTDELRYEASETGCQQCVVYIDILKVERPLPTVQTDEAEGHAGEPIKVNVLENDYAAPGGELRFLGATLTDLSAGTLEFNDNGDVTFTSREDFSGPVTVRYVVEDEYADLPGFEPGEREVHGDLNLNVLGYPDIPTAITVVDSGSHTVTLSWQQPRSNGSPIDFYKVEWTGVNSSANDGSTETCTTTTCPIDKLVNGDQYTFVVTAHNAVGYGKPSDPSAVVTVDDKPDRPAPPSLEFDPEYIDGQLVMQWTEPAVDGSPVHSYEIEIMPAPVSGPAIVKLTKDQFEDVDGKKQHIWTGLENGMSYTAAVTAINGVNGPGPDDLESDQSEFSTSVDPVPAKAPDQPAKPGIAHVEDKLTPLARASWEEPSTNGGPIQEYELHFLHNGQPHAGIGTNGIVAGVDPASRDHLVQTIDSTGRYRVKVIAINKAGRSDESEPSDEIRTPVAPRMRPGQTWNLRAADLLNQETTLSWNAPHDEGRAITRYILEIRRSNGSSETRRLSSPNNNNVRVTGLQNGERYTFRLRACNGPDDDMHCTTNASGQRAWSTDSNQIRPRGPLPSVSIWVSGNSGGTVTWSWSIGNNTSGRNITRAVVTINGTQYTYNNPGTSGSRGVNIGYYRPSHSASIVIYDEDNRTNRADNSGGATGANPNRGGSVGWGPEGSDGGAFGCGPGAGCRWLRVNLHGFAPNAVVSVTCQMNEKDYNIPGVTDDLPIRVDGNGNANNQLGNNCLAMPNGGNYRFKVVDAYGTVFTTTSRSP